MHKTTQGLLAGTALVIGAVAAAPVVAQPIDTARIAAPPSLREEGDDRRRFDRLHLLRYKML